jgi:hypothetical protein
LTLSLELLSSEVTTSFNNPNIIPMTKQELYTMAIRQFREYRAALVADFYEEKEAKIRLDEAKKAILRTVQKTNRFSQYSFSDLSWRAYQIVGKQEEGEAEFILALNRYLERCAESLREEVIKTINAREATWNAGTEMRKFLSLSEEYRKLFEMNIFSRESVKSELKAIEKRLIEIYIHPKMSEIGHLRCIVLEAIAKPTSNEESTNGVDAALAREAFSLLKKIHKAYVKKLKERSKNRGRH